LYTIIFATSHSFQHIYTANVYNSYNTISYHIIIHHRLTTYSSVTHRKLLK